MFYSQIEEMTLISLELLLMPSHHNLNTITPKYYIKSAFKSSIYGEEEPSPLSLLYIPLSPMTRGVPLSQI